MQLTFEIANLRLLLQGSLNDRFVTGNQRIKQHATIGFPISIEPSTDQRYKNAVAEVTATVTTWPDFYDKNQKPNLYAKMASVYTSGQKSSSGPVCPAYAGKTLTGSKDAYSDRACPDAPGLMAILPREKTYNVVDIRANSISLSGAATASVLTAGVTWYHATKHFYVVQAQDTVAFENDPKLQPNGGRLNQVSSTFGWQFRPVLNESRVRPGMRQLFAELSFPTLPPPDGKFYGTVTVEARWRHYDPKSGSVGDPIVDSRYEKQETKRIQEDSSAATTNAADIPSTEWIGAWELSEFDLTPRVPERGITWEESGSGLISVAVNGFYTPGTAVVLGANVYGPATPNYFYDPTKIRFVALATDLVRVASVFLEEQGGQQRVLDRSSSDLGTFDKLSIVEATAVPFNNTDMLVSVCYTGGAQIKSDDETSWPLTLLGGKVYGLSDQPYTVLPANPCKDSTNVVLTLRAPADAVRAAKLLKIKQLFDGPMASAEHAIEVVNDFSAAKAVTVAAANSCTLLAIQGSQLFFEPLGSATTNQSVHIRIGNQEIRALDSSAKDRCSFVPMTEQTPAGSTPKRANGQSVSVPVTGNVKSKAQPTDSSKGQKTQSPPKPAPCETQKAYVDTTLGSSTLLVASPDCLLKGVKQIEVYRGDQTVPRGRVQTVLLSVTEEKPAAAQIDTIEVQAGTKTIHLKGTHLELVDLNSLYFTGFVGISLGPKFPADASYIELTLPDTLTKTTGNYALNFAQQDKDKTPGGALVRVVKPKTQ